MINSIYNGGNLILELINARKTQPSNVNSNEIPNSKYFENQTLVLDKTQAVNKILGYGVDSEGYFTSDFNEAAALPKDYRINARYIEKLNQFLTTNQGFLYAEYSSIDWAKTLGNAYKELFEDKNLAFGESFGKEDFDLFQNGYENWETLENFSKNTLGNNSDYGISKGAALLANWGFAKIEGQVTTYGKLSGQGVDESEYNEFIQFMNKNQFAKSPFSLGLGEERQWSARIDMFDLTWASKYTHDSKLREIVIQLKDEYEQLLQSDDISLSEFKEKYLSIKERYDKYVEEYTPLLEQKMKEEFEKQVENAKKEANSTKQTQENNQENLGKTFTPIQGESKNKETYKDNNIRNELLKKLLENSFDTKKQLELLFGTKFDDDKSYNEFNQLFSQIRLNNNNVDLRV